MKFKRFEEMAKVSPWMWQYFPRKRGIYGYTNNPTNQRVNEFRDWLRCNVNYIAFRPWTNLNQLEHCSEQFKPIPSEPGHGRTELVEFDVLWHSQFVDEGTGRYTLNCDCPLRHQNQTIGQALQHIITFRLEYPSIDEEIHFDAVVKRMYTADSLRRDTSGEGFEIFPVPLGWVPEWMKTDRRILELARTRRILIPGLHVPQPTTEGNLSEHEREQYRRYVSGEPQLPIIPGMALA